MGWSVHWLVLMGWSVRWLVTWLFGKTKRALGWLLKFVGWPIFLVAEFVVLGGWLFFIAMTG